MSTGRTLTQFALVLVCGTLWQHGVLAAASTQGADLDGVWTLAKPVGPTLHTAQGGLPPLTAAGQSVYKHRVDQTAKGDDSFDLSLKCKPMGFPRTLWDGGPFDIQVQPGVATFFGYTWNRNHRLVYMADQLPPLQVPRFYGTSAGHWEGNTLVVQSGLFNANTLLDSSGLPHSEDMMLTERYSTSDQGRRLTVRLHVTDPTYYQKPWDVELHYNKVENGRIAEDVCEMHAPFFKDLLPRLKQ